MIKTFIEKTKEKFSCTAEVDIMHARLNWELQGQIISLVAEKMAKELYPLIKDKLLSSKEMTKLFNEVRLIIAKEVIKS